MASKTQVVPISKLLLDQSNARLGQIQPDQDSTVVALANKIGTQLLELAQDIVNFSLDPTTLMAITPEGAPPGKYRVIEGNRRLLTLKALKNPKILAEANLTPGNKKRLAALSESFRKDPIRSVASVVFDTEQEAFHWIDLRHTGANQGVGLVEWDSNEKDRYRSRHSGPSGRSPGGQVLDFVEKMRPVGSNAGKQRILTTLQRLISDPDVRTILGLSLASKNLYSHYPADEIIRSLSKVVSDLRSEIIKVTDVYHKGDRLKYIQRFGPSDLPNPTTQLTEPIPLTELSVTSPDQDGSVSGAEESTPSSHPGAISINGTVGTGVTREPNDATADTQRDSGESREMDAPNATPSGAPRSRVKPSGSRRTVIPPGCYLWIPDGRLNSIYDELRGLDVENFPNGCAVLLRVFFELSIDYHLDLNSIMTEQQRLGAKLTKKVKDLAEHLHSQGRISERIRRTAVKIADGTLLGVSVNSMNQYVHNTHTYPSATELRASWDEMQPIMAALWIKP